MENETVKYDAFISYRHADLDKYAAETLQRELESFRISKGTLKKLDAGKLKKTKIGRVFRDRDELPITSDLADPINKALAASEYLLVICSPRLKESLWCEREIETFIKMHGRENIFAVLIEGEPSESFPKQMCYEIREKIDENGNTIIENYAIEPLAADVRGNSRKEIRKKIREEVVRLAAPMFGCGYDDLKQRHREQKLKRVITAVSIGCAISLIFGAISTAMALQIKMQSAKIQEQSEELAIQYENALKTNAELEADNAMQILAKGDRNLAIDTAMGVLPTKETGNIPHTPKAQHALTEALYVYENGSRILPQYTLNHEYEVLFVKASPDGKRLIVVEEFGQITVWDAIEKKKLCEVQGNDTLIGEGDVSFINNDIFAYRSESGFTVYSLGQDKILYEEEIYFSNIITDEQGKYVAVASSDSVKVFDSQDWHAVYSCEAQSEYRYGTQVCLSGNRNLLGIVQGKNDLEDPLKSTENELLLIDLITGVFVTSYSLPDGDLGMLIMDEDTVYVTVHEEDNKADQLYFIYHSSIYAYAIDGDAKPIWTYYNSNQINRIFRTSGVRGEYIGYTTYDTVGAISKDTGDLMGSAAYGNQIVYCAPFTDDGDMISVITRNGNINYYDIAKGVDYGATASFTATSDNLKGALLGKGFIMTYAYNDTKPVIYYYALGDKVDMLYETEDYCSKFAASPDGKQLLFNEDDKVRIYDMETERLIGTYDPGDMVCGIAFREGETDRAAIVLLNRVEIIDTDTVSLIESFSFQTEQLVNFKCFTANGAYAVYSSYDSIYLVNTKDFSIATQAVHKEELDGNGVFSVSQDGTRYIIASKADKQLKLYDFSKNQAIKVMDSNTARIEELFFGKGDQTIYVVYADNTVEEYNTDTFELLRTYDDFQSKPEAVIYNKTLHIAILYSLVEGYILDEDGGYIGRIPGFRFDLPNKNEFITSSYYQIYKVPYFTYDMLIEEAERQTKN